MKEEKYKHGTQTELGVEGEEFNKYYSTTSHTVACDTTTLGPVMHGASLTARLY